jgi:hypothetical protein
VIILAEAVQVGTNGLDVLRHTHLFIPFRYLHRLRTRALDA